MVEVAFKVKLSLDTVRDQVVEHFGERGKKKGKAGKVLLHQNVLMVRATATW